MSTRDDGRRCSDSSVGTSGTRRDAATAGAGMFFNFDDIDRSAQLERQPRFSETSETIEMDAEYGDDPLESILNLTVDESALLLNGAGASISAALDAVANEIQAVSPNDAAAKAYVKACAREKFEPKPSPLGLGAPAMRYDASLWPTQLPKVMIPGDFFYNAPKRLVSKERQAQLDRYRAKRERRLLGLHKVARYECRKTLANARVRVKGRFVKASEEKEMAMKSIQSCPDLSALIAASDGTKAEYIPSSDDSVVYANENSSKRRISDDRASNSDASQGESTDFRKLQQLRDDGAPSTACGVGSHSAVSALRRTKKKQMRHCDSEICLTDLAGM